VGKFRLGADARAVEPVGAPQRLGVCHVGNDDCPHGVNIGLPALLHPHLVFAGVPLHRGQPGAGDDFNRGMVEGSLQPFLCQAAGAGGKVGQVFAGLFGGFYENHRHLLLRQCQGGSQTAEPAADHHGGAADLAGVHLRRLGGGEARHAHFENRQRLGKCGLRIGGMHICRALADVGNVQVTGFQVDHLHHPAKELFHQAGGAASHQHPLQVQFFNRMLHAQLTIPAARVGFVDSVDHAGQSGSLAAQFLHVQCIADFSAAFADEDAHAGQGGFFGWNSFRAHGCSSGGWVFSSEETSCTKSGCRSSSPPTR